MIKMLILRLVLMSIVCVPLLGGTELHVLGLFPITGEWDGGLSLLTAAQMALREVNNRTDILPGYTLKLTWENSNCSAGMGIKLMTDNLYNGPTKIIIVGGACSTVSQATSQASHLWNLVQVSYGSSSPALSIKTRFPKFMRLCPADSAVIPVRIRVFQQMGWTRVATIYQPYDLFSMVNDDLLVALQAANITVLLSEVFKESPINQVHRLKEKDARIIIGGFYPEQARPVFCESYKLGLIYPRVIWFLIGWLNIDWWAEYDAAIDCTVEEMARAVEGAIYMATTYMDPEDTPGVSGLRPSEFMSAHYAIHNRSLSGDIMATQGYDVMWAVALGLNATLTSLLESGSNKSLEDFTYDDVEMGDLIHSNMLNLTFQSLAGHITFDANGDPLGYVKIEQFQNGKRKTIGYESETATGPINLSLIQWGGDGKPPPDGVHSFTRILVLSQELYGFMCGLAVLGFLLSVLFLAFNIYNRDIKFIKLSSPRMNNVILVGCMVTYVTVILSGLDPVIACKTHDYPSVLGWSITFGALFSKTWRVYFIFANVKLQKRVVKDRHLFLMVVCLTVFNLIVLLTWTLADPLYVIWEELYEETYEDGDVVVNFMAAVCRSTYKQYFHGLLFTVQGILLVVGAFLSWETRKVKVEALNDSRNIAVCIYNSAVLTLLYIIITVTVTLKPDLQFAFMATIYILDATSVQCIIFVPKVLQYRHHRLHPEDDRGGLTMPADKSMPSSQTSATLDNKLKLKDAEIAKLHEKINQLSLLLKTTCEEQSTTNCTKNENS